MLHFLDLHWSRVGILQLDFFICRSRKYWLKVLSTKIYLNFLDFNDCVQVSLFIDAFQDYAKTYCTWVLAHWVCYVEHIFGLSKSSRRCMSLKLCHVRSVLFFNVPLTFVSSNRLQFTNFGSPNDQSGLMEFLRLSRRSPSFRCFNGLDFT